MAMEILGTSRVICDLRCTVERVARQGDPVLVTGETGTGKELVARALHRASARSGEPLVAAACADLAVGFTGASEPTRPKRGWYRRSAVLLDAADRGALFLDEIADLGPCQQAELLWFLRRSVPGFKGGRSRRRDVRIISTTNRELAAEVAAGRFDADLWRLLAGSEIRIPPLRERLDDLALLFRSALAEVVLPPAAAEPPPLIPAPMLAVLRSYDWPGNVRELENEVQRAWALAAGGPILPEHFSHRVRAGRLSALMPKIDRLDPSPPQPLGSRPAGVWVDLTVRRAAAAGRALILSAALLLAAAPGCGGPGRGVGKNDAGNSQDGAGGGNGGGGGSGGSATDARSDAGSMCPGGVCLEDCVKPGMATFLGCRFYPAKLDQEDAHDRYALVIAVGNPSMTKTATVTLEAKKAGTWTTSATMTVLAGAAQVFFQSADTHVEETGFGRGRAYRLRSDVPVAVYQFDPPYHEKDVLSSGASLLHTAAAYGIEYYALARPGLSLPTQARSEVTIVAAVDGTTVDVTVSAATAAGPEIPALAAGATWTAHLDEGDVVSLAGRTATDDLSGTHVTADKPIEVFAGSEAYGPSDNTLKPDHTEEPMPPVGTWGKTFVATRIQNFVSEGKKPQKDHYQVLAAEDGTEVTFEGPPMLDLPAKLMLGRGEWKELRVPWPQSVGAGGFLITANKPLLVLQTSQSQPSSVLGVPVDQYLDGFFFVTLSYYRFNWITVVRKAGGPVSLDGMALDDALFRPVAGGFEAAEIRMAGCKDTANVCPHRIAGTQVLVLGFADDGCSYGYVGGMALRCIFPSTAGCR